MKTSTLSVIVFLFAVMGVLTLGLRAANASDSPFAVGFSASKDLKAAGKIAAEAAKAGLGGKKATLVFVTVICPKTAKPEELLSGVLEVFDRSMVYGSCNSGIISKDGVQVSGIGVFAASVASYAAMADLAGEAKAAGAQIGEQIKKANLPAAKTRLMLLVGNCHHPKNNEIVKGVFAGFGENIPVIGSAADDPKHVFFQGVAHKNAAIGILLAGDFTCEFGMETGGNKDSAEMITAAQKSAANATAAKGKPDFLFVFDCGGRFRKLNGEKKLADEMAAVAKSVPADVTRFGFYGQGEIGKKNAATPSLGSGFYMSCCAIYFAK